MKTLIYETIENNISSSSFLGALATHSCSVNLRGAKEIEEKMTRYLLIKRNLMRLLDVNNATEVKLTKLFKQKKKVVTSEVQFYSPASTKYALIFDDFYQFFQFVITEKIKVVDVEVLASSLLSIFITLKSYPELIKLNVHFKKKLSKKTIIEITQNILINNEISSSKSK